MHTDSVILKLHDHILAFQKAQRFAWLALGSTAEKVSAEISNTEESMLFAVNAEPDKSVKELSALLGLERSWVSRVVAALEEKKLIKAAVPPEDLRSKSLRVTAKGREVLTEAEKIWKEVMDRCLRPLAPAEKDVLERRLRALADALGAHDYRKHGAGSAVGYQLGRFSSVTGFFGRSLYGSKLSLTQVQVLYALAEAGDQPVQVTDIERQVPFDMSTVSRTLQSFEGQGWVRKTRSENDRRSFAIELTAAGKTLLEDYRRRAAAVLQDGLKKMSRQELNEFTVLYEKLVASLVEQQAAAQPELITVKAISAAHDLDQARTLLDDERRPGPGFETRHIGFYRGGRLAAVVEIERSRESGGIRKIRFGGEELPSARCVSLIKSCL